MFPRHGVGPEWMGWVGWVFPLVFLLLLVALVVFAFYMLRNRPTSVTGEDPLRSAARRYANGNLERSEFERVRRDLTGLPEDPVRAAALRLARGDITIAEFEQIRSRLAPDEAPDASGEAEPDKS